MNKKIINALLDHPILTTLLIVDFGILVVLRPPFIFSLLMMSGLVALCMFFGQKLSLFKI